MISMLTLFYIWGAINALLILWTFKTINYSLITTNNVVDIVKVSELNKKNFFKFNLFFIWSILGIFIESMFIYFAFYIFLIIMLKYVHRKYNWIINPTKFNINLNRFIRILHFLLISFPVVNYFFLKINISQLFYSLF